MLNLESCSENRRLADLLASGKADALIRRLPQTDQGPMDVQTLEAVARDFASLFYSALVQQMQKTVDKDEDESVIAQGARDFFGMFLPEVVAGKADDPLTRYMVEHLGRHYGDALDEQV